MSFHSDRPKITDEVRALPHFRIGTLQSVSDLLVGICDRAKIIDETDLASLERCRKVIAEDIAKD